jgi:hypothetical protein
VNKPAVSQAKMQRMRRALLADGQSFAGFVTLPNGAVMALAGDPAALTGLANAGPSSDPLDAELAEWDAQHGHGRR